MEEARKVVEGEKERAEAAAERVKVAESQRNKLVKQVAKLRYVPWGLGFGILHCSEIISHVDHPKVLDE